MASERVNMVFRAVLVALAEDFVLEELAEAVVDHRVVGLDLDFEQVAVAAAVEQVVEDLDLVDLVVEDLVVLA